MNASLESLLPGKTRGWVVSSTGAAHAHFRNWQLAIGNRQFCRGQSMVESALVMVLLSFVLFGMLQIALKLNGEQVQSLAVFKTARSRIVGFNDAAVEKFWFLNEILNSGDMQRPYQGLPAVVQAWREVSLIYEVINTSGTIGELEPMLDYAHWPLPRLPSAGPYDTYEANITTSFPLIINALPIPILSDSMGGTNTALRSAVILENHFPFYLQWN